MTQALRGELDAGRTLWQGIKDPPRKDRLGAPLKNTSNTDVKFYAGHLISMWYLGGTVYTFAGHARDRGLDCASSLGLSKGHD
jgi:carotenoid cleavage dioxygenase